MAVVGDDAGAVEVVGEHAAGRHQEAVGAGGLGRRYWEGADVVLEAEGADVVLRRRLAELEQGRGNAWRL